MAPDDKDSREIGPGAAQLRDGAVRDGADRSLCYSRRRAALNMYILRTTAHK